MIIFHDEYEGNITPKSKLPMEFTTKKIKASVHGMKEYLTAKEELLRDWDSRCEGMEIDWTAQIISASWGISSIQTTVTKIKGTVQLWKGEEFEEGFVEDNIAINISLGDLKGWTIKDDIRPQGTGELLSISEVEINIHTKEISIA